MQTNTCCIYVCEIKRIIATKSNICILVWRQTLFYMHESYISKNNKICFSWYMSRNNHLLMISWLIRKMNQMCALLHCKHVVDIHSWLFLLNVHSKTLFVELIYKLKNISQKSDLFWFFYFFKERIYCFQFLFLKPLQ